MKIAVTYEDGNSVWQHFGKTTEFKMYDVEDNKVVDSAVVGVGGASHGELAVFLANANVDVVLCGGVGAPMVEKLNAANMKVCPGVTGDCDVAVNAYLAGIIKGDSSAVHDGCHHH